MDKRTLISIAKALRNKEKLSDAQVLKLAELRRAANAGNHHVRVSKLKLREGEELWQFMDAIWNAVQTNRIVLADGSLDAWLVGIYDDHVIVEDGNTGRMFKSVFTRTADGEFSFAEPVEVRMVFVEVGDAAGTVERSVTKAAADEQIVNLKKASTRRWDFLPRAIARRGR